MAGGSSETQKLPLSPAPKRLKRNRFQKHLPSDVVEIIFSYIPINNVMQLGTASMRFINSWVMNRKLHFDKDFAEGRGPAEIARILDNVFRQHSGSKIDRFRLYFNHDGVESKAENWIRNSVEKGVEELHLDFGQGKEPFKIASDLLDFESIRVLRLTLCELNLPLKPKGLCSLSTLVLNKTPAPNGLIQAVFANYLLLENLELRHCTNVYHLRISAGKLKRFKELKLVEGNDLASVHIVAPSLGSFFYRGHFSKLNFNGGPPVPEPLKFNGPPAQLKHVILCCPPEKKFVWGQLGLKFSCRILFMSLF